MSRPIFILLFTIFITLATPSFSIAGDQEVLNHAILVNVNNKKITRAQLDSMGLILFKTSFPDREASTINEAELDSLSANALKELIIICLTEDEYDIRMNDEDDLNDIKIRTNAVDEEMKMLHLEDFKNTPLAERYARSKIIRRNIVYGTKSTMEPSPRDVKIFYLKNKSTVFTEQRQVRIRELFISQNDESGILAKKQAQMLHDTLKQKSIKDRLALFSEMAKEFSRDRFAKDGGLILTGTPGNFLPQDHTFERGDGTTYFPKEMIKAIQSLNAKGDLILTKSDKGWHIIMLDDLKGGRKVPISKCRTIIEGFLNDSNYEEAYGEWLVGKVAKSRISWNDGDAFPNEKITKRPNKEDSLRYLRAQLQLYMEQLRSSKKRR